MANQSRSFWFTGRGLAALGLIGAAAWFLFMEHRAHLTALVLYLILLLCPIMHLFMHRGHGHHSDGEKAGRDANNGSGSHGN